MIIKIYKYINNIIIIMTALISLIHSKYLVKIRFEMKEFYIFSRNVIDSGCKHYLNLQVGPLLGVQS